MGSKMIKRLPNCKRMLIRSQLKDLVSQEGFLLTRVMQSFFSNFLIIIESIARDGAAFKLLFHNRYHLLFLNFFLAKAKGSGAMDRRYTGKRFCFQKVFTHDSCG